VKEGKIRSATGLREGCELVCYLYETKIKVHAWPRPETISDFFIISVPEHQLVEKIATAGER
jgi:hypothetical protein